MASRKRKQTAAQLATVNMSFVEIPIEIEERDARAGAPVVLRNLPHPGRLTAQDLPSLGLELRYCDNKIRLLGDPNATDAIAQVKEAIAKRVETMSVVRGTWRANPAAENHFGACMSCADPMPHWKGGHCMLCMAAIERMKS